jgi:CDP-diacylglycerol--glycerol-3-phosphate 3-phosphatidyltransferase
MTLANQISLARLGTVPVVVGLLLQYDGTAEWPRIAAVTVFLISAISDGIDGYVARRLNQQSRLGQALDPLADKLLVNITYVFLVVNPGLNTPVPAWIPVIILSRDATVVLGAYLINEYYSPVHTRPDLLGKITTWFQMGGVVAVLLQLNERFVMGLLYAAVGITLLSFADYFFAGLKQSRIEQSTE